MFFLWLFFRVVGIDYRIASPIAVELSILSNFLLNNAWTFRDTLRTSPLGTRIARFHIAAAGGFVINWVVLVSLVEFFDRMVELANLVGIAAAFLWNYAFNVKWTWRQTE